MLTERNLTASSPELTILSCKFLLRVKQRDWEGSCLSREAHHKHCKPNRTDPLLLSNRLRSRLPPSTPDSSLLFIPREFHKTLRFFYFFSPTSPAFHQCPNAMLYQVRCILDVVTWCVYRPGIRNASGCPCLSQQIWTHSSLNPPLWVHPATHPSCRCYPELQFLVYQ